MNIRMYRKRRTAKNIIDDHSYDSPYTVPVNANTNKPIKTYYHVDEKLHLVKNTSNKQDVRVVQKRDYYPLANTCNIGYYLLAPIIVGVVFGLLFDNWLKTEPICVILGIGLGMVGSIYNLIKIVRDVEHY